MWKLNPATDKLVKWYVDTMCKALMNRIKTKTDSNGNLIINNIISKILIPLKPDGTDDDTIIKKLLIEKPKALYTLNNDLMRLIINEYDDSEFEDYLKAKRKTHNRTITETSLYNKYH